MKRAILVCLVATALSAREPRFLVRIRLSGPEDRVRLNELRLDLTTPLFANYVDAVVTKAEQAKLESEGLGIVVLDTDSGIAIPPEYHTVSETWAVLESLHAQYPGITRLDACGYGQRFFLPIPHFVISHNPQMREDEPAALFTGMHHAREPLGNEICLYAIRQILAGYPDSSRIRHWVDSAELHFLPIVNPEGFAYITDSSLVSPWWRKNLRDNGLNGGPINPDSDGVDLNRNYDWRWAVGGSPDPTSWTYRGPAPGSEREIEAVTRMAWQRRFLVGASYHSYGRVVMYPWQYGGLVTPDDGTLSEMATNLSLVIGGYTVSRMQTTGMSSEWLYGGTGMFDFLIETGLSFFPSAESIAVECEANYRGIGFLLDRMFYGGVTGHVRDSLSLRPVPAQVGLWGVLGDSVVPRTADSVYGRFYRLLRAGTYRFVFSAPGYESKTVDGVPVGADSLTKLEVLLSPIIGLAEGRPMPYVSRCTVEARPNPFRIQTAIRLPATVCCKELEIYTASGRLVRSLTVCGMESRASSVEWNGTDECGRILPEGVYICRTTGVHPGTVVRLVLAR
ncbi:MAG: M14 family zinc carboxypeptidase [candidate division WOR-3 bacterium]